MGNGLRFPYLTRTEPAGTQAGSMSRERKDRSKRSSRTGGKPTVHEGEGATGSEPKSSEACGAPAEKSRYCSVAARTVNRHRWMRRGS